MMLQFNNHFGCYNFKIHLFLREFWLEITRGLQNKDHWTLILNVNFKVLKITSFVFSYIIIYEVVPEHHSNSTFLQIFT